MFVEDFMVECSLKCEGKNSKSLRTDCSRQDRKMRRQIANCNERKRMKQINTGFESLRTLLPNLVDEKISKAAILQQATIYIASLTRERDQLREFCRRLGYDTKDLELPAMIVKKRKLPGNNINCNKNINDKMESRMENCHNNSSNIENVNNSNTIINNNIVPDSINDVTISNNNVATRPLAELDCGGKLALPPSDPISSLPKHSSNNNLANINNNCLSLFNFDVEAAKIKTTTTSTAPLLLANNGGLFMNYLTSPSSQVTTTTNTLNNNNYNVNNSIYNSFNNNNNNNIINNNNNIINNNNNNNNTNILKAINNNILSPLVYSRLIALPISVLGSINNVNNNININNNNNNNNNNSDNNNNDKVTAAKSLFYSSSPFSPSLSSSSIPKPSLSLSSLVSKSLSTSSSSSSSSSNHKIYPGNLGIIIEAINHIENKMNNNQDNKNIVEPHIPIYNNINLDFKLNIATNTNQSNLPVNSCSQSNYTGKTAGQSDYTTSCGSQSDYSSSANHSEDSEVESECEVVKKRPSSDEDGDDEEEEEDDDKDDGFDDECCDGGEMMVGMMSREVIKIK
ncbi:hypothetical protein HELRODRAFT_183458 [Helobdella robusta]|uniref:BHLH domain-containing protein n=1 Tax=Helobdella robusta TaxID=6412 RepID=T1FJP7_HELRO|nr:hypothetical protein HELRODRAFT_183458 [Helobdella robusta]ESO11143.1 hypothetical protein HELRODRAFT_183458 [Helobdella robusta]